MTKHVAALLAHGFEEAEAVIFIDIMRRLDIRVDILSCEATTALSTYFETPISADALLSDRLDHHYDAVMMPGGPKGTDSLTANPQVIAFLRRHIAQDKYICALCSSGAKVLAAHHLLAGRTYSTGDKLADKFADGAYLDQDVVVDGKFITAKGLGVSFEFAFTVARHLLSDNLPKVEHQASHIYFKHGSAQT
ncbi:ThiJ/PfpI-family thiamine biogenesis protein [Yersinia pestis biovar Medievalis str. Harbin 35]|uniref:DJ-1/PfpI family protein n=1 Tax=Yersinia pestis TaxID=632 RepID=UPI0001F55FD1|nr:DJ-1/PfpI family protein [Yersinia pestis]ADV97654.1 ThiJ/PfpI-family thiamine biogenesis protein [Yersinia pestis biovar Medievalis str. Harbin 35]AJJ44631.1 DJ-1/PfpI family protein [Yersinia pestis]AJK09249.1 DJ-1/PfpI family protein [Yersinia pestis]